MKSLSSGPTMRLQ